MRFDAGEIRRYYDRHTRAFLRYGQGGSAGVIHRAVWGPGVTTRAQAFHYVDDLIAERVRSLAAASTATLHAIDLGCGVGATLCRLAERLPGVRATGVTLSPLQAHIATDRIQAAGLADRVSCLEADYTSLPASVAPADLAYAIESFVHGPSPERFLAECARIVRPGGLLVIVDDFRRPGAGAEAARAIDRFCRGWRINTLLTGDGLHQLAVRAGFEHESTTDLSAMLELGRPRDRAIGLFSTVLGWLRLDAGPFGYLAGGGALQQCIARGWIGYDFVVFRKLRTWRPPSGGPGSG
jgi:tocopherol O-methyltransferase